MRQRRLAQIVLAAATLQRGAVLADEDLLKGLDKVAEDVDLTKALDKVAKDAIHSTEDLAKLEPVKQLEADVHRDVQSLAESDPVDGAVAPVAANVTAGSTEPVEGLAVDAPAGGTGDYHFLRSIVLVAGLLVGLLYFRERHKKQRTIHLAGDTGDYVSGGYIGSDDYYSSPG